MNKSKAVHSLHQISVWDMFECSLGTFLKIVILTSACESVQVNDYREIEMNPGTELANCGTKVAFNCHLHDNTPFVQWLIGVNVTSATLPSAQCLPLEECIVSNNYSGRYAYSFDSGKLSRLVVNPISLEDNNREYLCNGNSTTPLMLSVKTVPTIEIMRHTNTTTQNGINFTVFVPCVFPKDSVTMTWMSTQDDLSDVLFYPDSKTLKSPCTENSTCTDSHTSETLYSSLELFAVNSDGNRKKREASVGRFFYVIVDYQTGNISYQIPGLYTLKGNVLSNISPPIVFTTTTTTNNVSSSHSRTNLTSPSILSIAKSDVTTATLLTSVSTNKDSERVTTSTYPTNSTTTNSSNITASSKGFFEKYKVQSIIVGCAIIFFLVIVLAIFVVYYKRRAKKKKEKGETIIMKNSASL